MAVRSLRKEFGVAIGASETALRVNSDEMDDALKTLTEVAKEYGWELRVWDHTVGTQWYNGEPPKDEIPPTKKSVMGGPPGMGSLADALGHMPPQAPNPMAEIMRFLQEVPKPDPSSKGDVQPVILVMKNFHLAFEGGNRGPVVSAIQHLISDKVSDHPKWNELKEQFASHGIGEDTDTGKFLVGLMPATDETSGKPISLPPEISPLFAVIDHEIPDIEEMYHIFDGVMPVSDSGDPLISDESRTKSCKFALGLTRLQAEGVFSRAAVRYANKKNFETILPEFVWKAKTEILNREGLVVPYEGKETFDDVVGNEGMKQLLVKLLRPDELEPDNSDLRSRGICAVGPPRTGKSLTIKALGNVVGMPVYRCDPGRLMGEYVGSTERMTRKFFQLLKVLAPCIGWIDEVEKVMPSGKSSKSTSGGVDTRMAGTFMTQMQDMEENIFWAFTANSVKELHEAFLDDDRIDLKFYVKMPTREQLAAGWKLFLGKFFPAKHEKIYLETDFEVLFLDFIKAKKVNPVVWGNRFSAAILSLCKGEARDKALLKLKNHDPNVHSTVMSMIIDDEGWTIARIKTVCRLSRKLKIALSEAAKLVPSGQQRGRIKVIAECDDWAAEEGPVDAETGLVFVPYEEDEDTEAPVSRGGLKKDVTKIKARRKIRKSDED